MVDIMTRRIAINLRKLFLLGVVWLTVGSPVQGQLLHATGPLPSFEVATVKPVDMQSGTMHTMGVMVYPGGRVRIQGFPLKSLIMVAFNLSYWQISGGDDWTAKVEYDVEGKPSDSSGANTFNTRYTLFGIADERLRQMLQALLIERFQLKFHRESRTGTVSILERSGKTLQLLPTKVATSERPSDDTNFGSIGWAGDWVVSNTTMPHLAKFAGDYILHRPVMDKTGLAGAYDFRYTMTQADADAEDAMHAGAFLSMIQEMGLKLESAKGPVETLVIEHAEKTSEN